MTRYRVKGRYPCEGNVEAAVKKLVHELQSKAFDEGVAGFFEVAAGTDGWLEVTFKRDLEEDQEYAEERCPGDLRAGLIKQLRAELDAVAMGPHSLEWIEDNFKAFRVVEKKLRWDVATYEPVMADTKEEAQEAVATGYVDDCYQGTEASQPQETIYEVTEIAKPIPKRPRPCCPFCRHEGLKMGLPTWVAKSTDSAPHGFSAILHEYRCESCDRPFFVSDDDDELKPEEKVSDQVHAV